MNQLRKRSQVKQAKASASRHGITEISWNDRAALPFAIEFAQASPDDAVRSSAQVFEFANATLAENQDANSRTVLEIQSTTHHLLRELVQDGIAGYDLRLSGVLLILRDRKDRRRRVVRSQMNSEAMSVGDRFLHRLVGLLEGVNAARLQLCQAPKPGGDDACGRVFLKLTRKEFCSPKCQSRAYMRNLRRAEAQLKVKGVRRGKKTRTR